MSNVTERATVGGNATVKDKACVRGDATVRDSAVISGIAYVEGCATVRDSAVISGIAYVGERATVGGSACITERASITGFSNVSGNVKIGGSARVRGTAVVSEQKHVAWEYFRGRSGVYTLTLFMQANSSIGFVWGCRRGDDLRAYFAERPDYAERGLEVAPLEFLEAFEKANGMGAYK